MDKGELLIIISNRARTLGLENKLEKSYEREDKLTSVLGSIEHMLESNWSLSDVQKVCRYHIYYNYFS